METKRESSTSAGERPKPLGPLRLADVPVIMAPLEDETIFPTFSVDGHYATPASLITVVISKGAYSQTRYAATQVDQSWTCQFEDVPVDTGYRITPSASTGAGATITVDVGTEAPGGGGAISEP
jgi:hypothetical protein